MDITAITEALYTISDAIAKVATAVQADGPMQQAPMQQAPVQQEPVQQEPVQQEPVQQEPVQQEPVQQEPVQQEPVAMDFSAFNDALRRINASVPPGALGQRIGPLIGKYAPASGSISGIPAEQYANFLNEAQDLAANLGAQQA